MNMNNKQTILHSIDSNSQKLDGGAMFGNAPKEMWRKWINVDDLNRINLATRGLLIQTAGKKILCEVGIGNFFEPQLGHRYGVQNLEENNLLKNLQRLGLSHTQIDFVILSHLHFDHAGGLLPSYAEQQRGTTDLLFPNAQYIVSKEAFARSQNPHPRDRASYISGLAEKLINSNRLYLVDGDNYKNILPDNISFIETHGHTPGQLHTLIQGEKSSMFFCGDTIPGIAWLNIAITMGYDRFAELVIDEKSEIIPKALAEQWMFFYTHDENFVASRLQKNEKGKIEAVDCLDNLDHFAL